MRPLMKRLAASLCLLLLAAHSASAKDAWMSVRSQNFFLVGNASEKEIRQVATRLEQFRDVFTRLFPNANFKTPVPTTVVVFKSDSAYKPFKPVVSGKPIEVAGYFQPGEEVNYITLTTERGAENPYSTIYHEYTHLLVNNTLGKTAAPPWFNEGLAEYYSTFEISDDRKVFLGRLIDNHLLYLRQQKLIPLRQLFDVDYYSLERNKHDTRSLFYAESWALVHYLILGNDGKRLPQLGRFIDLLGKNTPTEKAFGDAFQSDIASMEKELKGYIGRNSFRGQVVTFERKLEFDSGMQSAPLTEAEAEGYLGDLLAHIGRPGEAVARLERALKLDPKLSMAYASLGTLLTRQKRFDEAKTHLREAVAGGERSYLAHYYYAYTLSREGMDESGRAGGYDAAVAREMREHLLKAIELKPDFPESYHLLAFVHLVENDNLDEALKMISRARALAPGNEHYALVLAQVYMRQENFDAARKTVEPLARDASDPQMRAFAKTILDAVQTMQEQAARFKAMRESAASGGGEAARPPRLTRRDDAGDAASGQTGKSEDELVAEALSSAIGDALRKPLSGETRARGTLTRVECGARGLVFVVKVGERLLRLSAKTFEELHIMAFTSEAGSVLSCGPRKIESPVVVTYRTASDARAKTDGPLVALEFVPASFQLKQ
ncbi:MAG TPA: tetratricopeptide repeat protein [Pyrinomonadaceae bacterium]|nr:tetratricopeptide repeat protein [Pyrinomonadaceae bacterium]